METKKILLVGDLELFLGIEKSFFKRVEFNILTAQSGKEALSIICAKHPDLIFMDLFMPEMDGDECCQAVKKDKNLRHIPIVMATAGEGKNDFERCWQAGCDEVIAKPINRNLFLETTQLTIDFILPNRSKQINCSGRVAWLNHPELIKNPKLPIGMGLQFTDLTLYDLNILREYLHEDTITPFF